MSEQRHVLTEDLMTKGNVITIDGLATVRDAMRRMRDSKVTCLVVDKRHPHDAYGMVALLDIVKNVIAAGRSPDETHIYEVMTKPILTVRPEMDVRYVAGLFVNFRLRRAPVESREGQLIGMISLSDIVMKGADLL